MPDVGLRAVVSEVRRAVASRLPRYTVVRVNKVLHSKTTKRMRHAGMEQVCRAVANYPGQGSGRRSAAGDGAKVLNRQTCDSELGNVVGGVCANNASVSAAVLQTPVRARAQAECVFSSRIAVSDLTDLELETELELHGFPIDGSGRKLIDRQWAKI